MHLQGGADSVPAGIQLRLNALQLNSHCVQMRVPKSSMNPSAGVYSRISLTGTLYYRCALTCTIVLPPEGFCLFKKPSITGTSRKPVRLSGSAGRTGALGVESDCSGDVVYNVVEQRGNVHSQVQGAFKQSRALSMLTLKKVNWIAGMPGTYVQSTTAGLT